jgi:hypothetical protein
VKAGKYFQHKINLTWKFTMLETNPQTINPSQAKPAEGVFHHGASMQTAGAGTIRFEDMSHARVLKLARSMPRKQLLETLDLTPGRVSKRIAAAVAWEKDGCPAQAKPSDQDVLAAAIRRARAIGADWSNRSR